MVTIKDVAVRAGVTDTTVSLAFQPDSRISDKTRKKIVAIADELGYIPSHAARQLRKGNSRSKQIAVLVNDITNPFYALIAKSSEEVAATFGYDIIIRSSQWQPQKELAEIESIIRARLDGVLACFCEKTRAGAESLIKFKLPFLVIDTCPAGYTGSHVVNDLAEAGRLAAKHLTDIGCRRLAFVTADASMNHFSSFIAMGNEFAHVTKARRLPFSKKYVAPAGLTIASGIAALPQLLAMDNKIDGIFCASSMCAMGIIEAADRMGIPVGSKLAVMGVDDLDVCQLSRVSLTVIRQPYQQLAQIATEILIKSIEQKVMPDVRMSMKPELIVRNSTKR